MLSVKTFFKMVFDVDVTQSSDDIGTDVNVQFLGKDDEPVNVNIPIAIQTVALGLFILWKKMGDMPADYFCNFFDEILREVFQGKLKELEQKANTDGEGGEVVSLASHRLGSKSDGESN